MDKPLNVLLEEYYRSFGLHGGGEAARRGAPAHTLVNTLVRKLYPMVEPKMKGAADDMPITPPGCDRNSAQQWSAITLEIIDTALARLLHERSLEGGAVGRYFRDTILRRVIAEYYEKNAQDKFLGILRESLKEENDMVEAEPQPPGVSILQQWWHGKQWENPRHYPKYYDSLYSFIPPPENFRDVAGGDGESQKASGRKHTYHDSLRRYALYLLEMEILGPLRPRQTITRKRLRLSTLAEMRDFGVETARILSASRAICRRQTEEETDDFFYNVEDPQKPWFFDLKVVSHDIFEKIPGNTEQCILYLMLMKYPDRVTADILTGLSTDPELSHWNIRPMKGKNVNKIIKEKIAPPLRQLEYDTPEAFEAIGEILAVKFAPLEKRIRELAAIAMGKNGNGTS